MHVLSVRCEFQVAPRLQSTCRRPGLIRYQTLGTHGYRTFSSGLSPTFRRPLRELVCIELYSRITVFSLPPFLPYSARSETVDKQLRFKGIRDRKRPEEIVRHLESTVIVIISSLSYYIERTSKVKLNIMFEKRNFCRRLRVWKAVK